MQHTLAECMLPAVWNSQQTACHITCTAVAHHSNLRLHILVDRCCEIDLAVRPCRCIAVPVNAWPLVPGEYTASTLASVTEDATAPS